MSEDFIDSLSASFEAKGAQAIRRACEENPRAFLQVVAGLIREEHLADRGRPADLTFGEVDRMLKAITAGQ